jgi:hypothetical protein
MSVLAKLKALDEERAKLLDGAKRETLEKIHKAIVDLNELGFQFSLIEKASSSPSRPPKLQLDKQSKRRKSGGPCPICQFKTQPLHDGRLHRSQDPKRPFSLDELQKRGLQNESAVSS